MDRANAEEAAARGDLQGAGGQRTIGGDIDSGEGECSGRKLPGGAAQHVEEGVLARIVSRERQRAQGSSGCCPCRPPGG